MQSNAKRIKEEKGRNGSTNKEVESIKEDGTKRFCHPKTLKEVSLSCLESKELEIFL